MISAKRQITRLLEKAKIPRDFRRPAVQAIDVRYIGELSAHGTGLYVRIPKEILDYYGLVAGDKVKIAILQRKKWTDIENQE